MIPKWLSLVLLIYRKMTATYARSASRAELLFCFFSWEIVEIVQLFRDQVGIAACRVSRYSSRIFTDKNINVVKEFVWHIIRDLFQLGTGRRVRLRQDLRPGDGLWSYDKWSIVYPNT